MATQALGPCHFSFSGAEAAEKSHWLWVSVNKTPSESPRMKLGLFLLLFGFGGHLKHPQVFSTCVNLR